MDEKMTPRVFPNIGSETHTGYQRDMSQESADTERKPTNLDSRLHQIFFDLTDHEISRVSEFAEEKTFEDGALLLETGVAAPGMFVIVSGTVRLSHRDGLGNRSNLSDLFERQFIAETSTLSGMPSLVDGTAVGQVSALLVRPERLRAMIVAEADFGERLMRSMILRRARLIEKTSGPILVGDADDVSIVRLQEFLRRNGCPHSTIDTRGGSEAKEMLAGLQNSNVELPAVIFPDGSVLGNPSEVEIATRLGLASDIVSAKPYDVMVVGAGPAGLATAVYAASEGLSVVVVDSRAPGGQAGASARIENYLGFPTGISGHALARRAYVQAQKFGTRFSIPLGAQALRCDSNPVEVQLADGVAVGARTVVIASGAAYRRPNIPHLEKFEGKGIYYWASPVEARLCTDSEVVLVGGGNSAGQAIVFLASHAKHVHVLIRRDGLEATMSKYLIDRISGLRNVTVHSRTEIESLEGEAGVLTSVMCRTNTEPLRLPVRHLFLFTGAIPNTEWLSGCGVMTDAGGFVITGRQPTDHGKYIPASLETTVPGVFAIGDVRSESTKRVAAAVGEGAQVVAQIHRYLSSHPEQLIEQASI
ncbi:MULTISPECIES: FAD-dependent oxidoreductase [unclassified Paraburkholderia]|uniref:FAD-dependent oxidoreductase n=1 Tax=unclassified Paraburkholderia TaxID=2615204 RepID=UPI0016187BE5|nr:MULTISPECIES: FAD-dependent oxidoreductase [unclassified Paraburkholderia]MBB5447788.1 thioredoxin reductase (NADPH) [Paraburkholderia sp. WSM4177]MBB5488275.1 thioredoxin reductase (NADPH) [Paraburkholderia sp. WSM4180]